MTSGCRTVVGMLHIQLLGPLLAHDDAGADLTPPGARERNGLATLAVVSPDQLSTERLATELYREQNTSDPRNAIQAMISRLRKALGQTAGSIETTTSGYRLVDVTLDVDEAERLLHATMAEPDPVAARALLEQAEALWHGPTLDGLAGELVDAERIRIDNLRADAEDAVFERRLAAGVGADPGLGPALEAAVRDQPLRERRWELLMRTLYRDGRQADALRAFQRARTLLSSHLGLDPGPSLVRLEQQILAHDPTLDADQHSDPGTASPGSDHRHDPGSASGFTVGASPGDSLPRGTLTVLLCDVEGSVRQWESNPAQTGQAIAELHRIWGDATEAWSGHMVKSTGDGVLAVFTTASGAINAAAQAMSDQMQSSLVVRAAVHTGSLEPVEADYRGPVINRCARLLELAHGGQTLISGITAELAGPELGDLSLRDMGSHWLRDVPDPIRVWQLEGPGLPASFPPLPPNGPASLPRLRGTLLGREELVSEIARQADEDKLVTLLGPGGIGKTSAALAAAWELAGGRPVTFVDLARVTNAAAVEDRIVDAVVTVDHDIERRPAERLADRLQASTDLVIVDNAEHVLGAVASLIDQVLQYELKGSFLVTSRQPLGLSDEVIIGVPPLELPIDGDDLGETGRSPSVRLFLDRAKANRPDLAIQSGLLPVVAHICRRLDGLPLAIELAAGRASVLSIDDIAARLDDQLRLLRQVRSQRDRRHQSLEVVVGWSVEQLTNDARELFERLSVMAGSFGIDGVERLLRRCDLDRLDALETLGELQEASLLVVEPGGSRFRMLEPIRQVAAARLDQRNLDRETRRAQVLSLTEMTSDAHYRRDHSRVPALNKIDDEADQLTSAIAWIAESGEADLAPEISFTSSWWFLTRDARLGEQLLKRLVPLVDRETDPVGWALVVLGLAIVTASDPGSDVADTSLEAVSILDEADHPDRGLARIAAAFAQTGGQDIELTLQLLEDADRLISPDDLWGRALTEMSSMTIQSLWLMVADDGIDGTDRTEGVEGTEGVIDPEAVVARGLKATAMLREIGENWALGAALGELGRLMQSLGRIEEAERCYIESLELSAAGVYHGTHFILTELGKLASQDGRHSEADGYHERALELANQDGNAGCIATAVAGLAHAAEARGEAEQAMELYHQALELAEGTSLMNKADQAWVETLEQLAGRAGEPQPPSATDQH